MSASYADAPCLTPRFCSQLPEHFNAEAVAGTIGSRADAVDYLTWTFLFRRLLGNPSYYDLQATDPDDVNAFLSELVEDTLVALEVPPPPPPPHALTGHS